MATYFPDFRQGDTVTVKIQYPALSDITGYKFWLSLVAQFGATPVAQVSTTAGDDPRDEVANGICYLTIPSTTSVDIPPGKYYYDIQRDILGTVPLDTKTIAPPPSEYKDILTVVPAATVP